MNKIYDYLDDLMRCYSKLEVCRQSIIEAYELLVESYRNDGKLLVAGNGGSASDAEHIVGELMKSFVLPRKMKLEYAENLVSIEPLIGAELADKLQGALPAIALVNHTALSTAFLNDVDPFLGFAQQIYGYGQENDVFLGITTSEKSKNIIYAAVTAKAKGMKVIALTGKDGGNIKDIADISIIIPEDETYKIQELHLPVYHCLCLMLEREFFG